MSEQRPVPPGSPTSETAALRQTGAAPLHRGDPVRIGPYLPLALLGSGGMGRVYLACPADGGPGLVAVKVIRPEYADDSQFRRRFEREASVHARIRTPHTPRLCGTGFQDELLWMATEYLPGHDLADAVRENGPLETAAVWRLVAELGRALADLAAADIVHRDLKPSNVLLCVHGAYVIDFGLSKAVDASSLTGTGNRVGTPAYMSPEHLRTGTSDTRSDVFSLAGTLVYAATGRAPFGDGSGVDVMHRVAFEEPNPELIGEISAADPTLGSLLSACLAKEPERRPAPQELIDAAGTDTGTAGWPEPLAGRTLARQRAFEVLRHLPVERKARLRTPADPATTVPPHLAGPAKAVPAHLAGPAEAVPSAPAERTDPSRPAPDPSVGTSPEPLRTETEAGTRARSRKKPLLAVAAGVVLFAVAAGIFVLVPQDAPATAGSPEAGASTAGGVPGGTASPPTTSGAPERTVGAAESAEGAANTGGGAESPESSGSAGTGRRGSPAAPSAPSVEHSASAGPGTATSGSPPEPGTPPWISDCTHYSGNGRTRQGDSGKRVLQVQCMLTRRGYSVGSTGPDGEFGPGTASAVRSFQSARGLEADGIVGHDTWTALRSTE
ncbi:serine/threonine protein kinase [Streptomyces sp. LBL]|uniref:protein kinase domain-containing protein n=1 Tax=Streptomyces sp. LBL TaxID=2940562 RepID=UPI002473616B|nr:protein kinase [Streptomyces sp. LBL]MDH6622793.1 serine/threonine protein kinase [Streptomyces sp. LBL]